MLNTIGTRFSDSSAATITIGAPGTGKYNLVKSISGYSDATASIAICSPSTTTVIWAGICGITQPLVLCFPDGGEPTGTENGAVKVTCSAGTYRISVTGKVSSP